MIMTSRVESSITPKFLDITRADGKPRIRFGSNENPQSQTNAFAQILAIDPDLTIQADGGEILFVDKNGTTSLQSLRNSGGGGGGGTFPNAGIGLYYTGSTLNVDSSVVLSEDSSDADVTFNSLNAEDIYLGDQDLRSLLGLTNPTANDDGSTTFAAFDEAWVGTWIDLVKLYNADPSNTTKIAKVTQTIQPIHTQTHTKSSLKS